MLFVHLQLYFDILTRFSQITDCWIVYMYRTKQKY